MFNYRTTMKLTVTMLSFALLASCGNKSEEEAKALSEKVNALETEKALLASKVQELQETEPNVWQRCKEVAAKTDNGASRGRLAEVEEALKLCAGFVAKFPNSPQVEEASRIVAQKKRLQAVITVLDDIDAKVKAGEFASAKRAAEALHGEVDDLFVAQILDGIEKQKHAPASISYRELHKLVSTGMPIGKQYSVEASLMPDGRYLCIAYAQYCLNSETMIRVEENLNLEKSRQLYDLRGKSSCFLVRMERGGDLIVDDFQPGKCN